MDKTRLKTAMIRSKPFLGLLYKSNPMTAKQILNHASDFDIKTLLNVVHFLAKGEIKIRREDVEKLNFSRKTSYLHKTFGTRSKVLQLSKSSRGDRINALTKLAACYPNLLYL